MIGGNGSLTVACKLHEEHGMPIVGVPKTIDNDIVGTDVTFGFHTAVQIATDAIDRLHTTAESHDRVMVVEVMGRHSGWIATHAGIAGGATMVLIPEIPFDIDEICRRLSRRHERNRFASIVVVAEGAEPVPGTLDVDERTYDRFGHVLLGGISDVIAREIAERTGFETRVVMLGHVQRGGTPTAYDRVLCTRFGVAAINLVHERGWGQMVVARGQRDRAGAAVAGGRQVEAGRPRALRRRPGVLRLSVLVVERHGHDEERPGAHDARACPVGEDLLPRPDRVATERGRREDRQVGARSPPGPRRRAGGPSTRSSAGSRSTPAAGTPIDGSAGPDHCRRRHRRTPLLVCRPGRSPTDRPRPRPRNGRARATAVASLANESKPAGR